MDTLSIIKLFYIIYTAYTLFVMSVSNYNFFHAFWGLLAMWFVYFAFSFGYRVGKGRAKKVSSSDESKDRIMIFNILEWSPLTYIFNVILCWICTILSAKFYTGKSVIEVINYLLNGQSLYASYQRYFRVNNLAVFSSRKIIYILMLTYVTIMFVYSFTMLLLSDKKISVSKILYLFCIGASYLYFGISRGTNIEMYMIFILLSYCILNRHSQNGASPQAKKTIIIVGILGSIVIYFFRLVLTVRGSVFENTICQEISYDPNSLVSKLFPNITNILLSIFSYLGYGIYAIGVTVSDIFMHSFPEATASILPLGFETLIGKPLPDILKGTIEVGVRWIPDWVSFVSMLGFPLFMYVIFVFGWVTSRIITSNLPKVLINICSAFIFMQMLSLPVGNFVFNNTPTVLAVLFTIGCCLRSKITIRTN